MYETANGKQLQVTVAPNTALYRISFTSGGELPALLTGLFTTPFEAEKAILVYLNKKDVRKNGKSTTSKTDN